MNTLYLYCDFILNIIDKNRNFFHAKRNFKEFVEIIKAGIWKKEEDIVSKKKIHILILAVIMWLSMGHIGEAATIKIFIDGKQQYFDQQPMIENDRVLVPLRGIFESLNATVNYEDATKEIYATKAGNSVWLKTGSKQAKVNGQTVILDSPAKIKNGRTFVPLRFIGESLGCKVEWDGINREVRIKSNSEPIKKEEPDHRIIEIGDPVELEIPDASIVIESDEGKVEKGPDGTIIVK